MTMKTLLAAALLTAGIASADTISSHEDTFTSTMDRESNGLHVVVNGDFTYNQPGNGTVVGLSDLTSFSMTLTDQFAYGWNGVPPHIMAYSLGMDSIQSFSFDTDTEILTESILVIPSDPDHGTFTMEADFLGLPIGDAPEVGIFNSAYGPASDPSVAASSVPEPTYAVLAGLLLTGLGYWRKR